MLERFTELANILNEMFLEKPHAPSMPTAVEFLQIERLMQLLKPLEHATKEASGENYITISKVIPLVSCILQQYEKSIENDELLPVKKVLLNEINRRFGSIEDNMLIAIATILDPRFKTLHFRKLNAVERTVALIKSSMQADTSSNESDSDLVTESSENYSSEFWSHHTTLAHGQKSKKPRTSKAKDELSLYLSNGVGPLSQYPLKQWEDMKNIYPNLYNQMKKYFTIVATSVPAERLFSKAGATVTEARNRLGGKRLKQLLFLNSVSE